MMRRAVTLRQTIKVSAAPPIAATSQRNSRS